MDEAEINALTVDLLPADMRQRIELRGECWIWTRSINHNGYGQIEIRTNGKRKNWLAHRLVYSILVGDPGENLHHWLEDECDKRCVRPSHVHPMSASDHARGHNPVATHCSKGHSKEDAIISVLATGEIRRSCRTCNDEQWRKRRDAQRVQNGLPTGDLRRKITTEQSKEIQSRYHDGESPSALATEFGLTPSYVWELGKR